MQYDKGSWRNRNRIKTPNGIQWITVPVQFKLSEGTVLNKIKINNTVNWRKKHLLSIKNNYSKSLFFKKYIDILEEAYTTDWDLLIDIDMFFIKKIVKSLNLTNKEIVLSSGLNIEGDTLERLVKMCKVFKADIFYEGSAGKNYIDEDYFNKNNIRVEYQDYKHPVYDQLHGDFIPYLSVIDLLFNHGNESLSILLNKEEDLK